MDEIKRAIERAKSGGAGTTTAVREHVATPVPALGMQAAAAAQKATMMHVDRSALEKARIVAHLPGTPPSNHFDLLRTRVLQHMWSHGMKTLAITSPTPGCGKTVTAINLAISMARLDSGHTTLVDLDLRKPQVANYLSIRPRYGVYDALSRRVPLGEALISIDIAGEWLSILPTIVPAQHPSETIGSQDMKQLVKDLSDRHEKGVVIFDMPPLLFADDLISFIPNVDAVLLIAASGQTTDTELSECLRMIPEAKLAGVVLTKSEEKQRTGYYGYY